MLDNENRMYIAHAENKNLYIIPSMANRHGLIAGATGTGKTVSLQVLAETFSSLGVPCFMADMKGDLSGVYKPGTKSKFIEKREPEFGIQFTPASYPVHFYDVYGEQGVQMRVTVKDFGVMLFSRVMSLNETQEGVLTAVFKIAADKNLELIDLKDLRAALNYVGQNAKEFQTAYGNISSATIGAIQRGLLALEEQGGNLFFGEPAFEIKDLIKTNNNNGKGVINILAADKLYNNPRLYSAFLMWLLTTIYNTSPEVGDQEKPRFVFFFDEAHLLFDDASKALLEQIEKIVRLIRSKGVGVYFITQCPTDIPENVLGQLGNKVQHALRAFTPKEQKAVKAVAQAFRANEAFDTEKVLLELETGEALISFLDEKGAPCVVEKAKMLFPQGQIGPITPEERRVAIKESGLEKKYGEVVDRESAYEKLIREAQERQKAEEEKRKKEEEEKKKKAEEKEKEKNKKSSGKRSSAKPWYSTLLTSLLRSFGNKLINAIFKTKKK